MAALSLAFSGTLAAADYYLISRDGRGHFRASHNLSSKWIKGYEKVVFCSKEYWVRPHSVAWSKWEEQQGRNVNIEENQGNGWKIICLTPSKQVRLKDVGILLTLEETMDSEGSERRRANRLASIRRAFSADRIQSSENPSHHNPLQFPEIPMPD